MPDLITHVTLSHVLRRLFDLANGQKPVNHFRILFYIGTVLPDVLTRPFYIILPINIDWTVALHTPLGALLSCSIFALLFEVKIRKIAFLNLTGGAGIHFLLDSLQKQVSGDNFWLFPLSYKDFSFGLMWAGDIIPLIPLWIGLVIMLEFGIYSYGRLKS